MLESRGFGFHPGDDGFVAAACGFAVQAWRGAMVAICGMDECWGDSGIAVVAAIPLSVFSSLAMTCSMSCHHTLEAEAGKMRLTRSRCAVRGRRWEGTYIHGGWPCSNSKSIFAWVHCGCGLGHVDEVIDETFARVWSPHVTHKGVIRQQHAVRLLLLLSIRLFGLASRQWEVMATS
jgi:hypothetical protein